MKTKYPEQIPLLIKSLEFRRDQLKNALNTLNDVPDEMISDTCPLCQYHSSDWANESPDCDKCIADESTDICVDYTWKVRQAIKTRKDRDKLLRWLNYQIRKWKKIDS